MSYGEATKWAPEAAVLNATPLRESRMGLGADAVRNGWARSSQLVNAAIECDDITLLDVLVVQYRQG